VPDLVEPKDFGPSKPSDDLDDMFGPEPEPREHPLSKEGARQLADQWEIKVKEKTK
jgi:hypothetical protein